MGTRRRKRRLAAAAPLLIALAACGLIASCGQAAPSGPAAGTTAHVASAPSGTITEAGSSLLLPLMKVWASDYQAQVHGVTVSATNGGSGAGIADAESGAKMIGASDAYLSSGDLLGNPALLNIPLAVSAQSVIYNLPGLQASVHGLHLTGLILAQMYSGTIKYWDDKAIQDINLGVTIPHIPVRPLHRDDISGDTFLFTSYLSTQSPDWASAVGYGTRVKWPANGAAVVDDKGSMGMYNDCAAIKGCVGYNGWTYYQSNEQALGLGQAALETGGGGFFQPSADSIMSQVNQFIAITPPNETIAMVAGPGGYPLVNYEYAVVNPAKLSPAQATLVREFLNWVVTTGNAKQTVEPENFEPLPADIQVLSENQIREIK